MLTCGTAQGRSFMRQQKYLREGGKELNAEIGPQNRVGSGQIVAMLALAHPKPSQTFFLHAVRTSVSELKQKT